MIGRFAERRIPNVHWSILCVDTQNYDTIYV